MGTGTGKEIGTGTGIGIETGRSCYRDKDRDRCREGNRERDRGRDSGKGQRKAWEQGQGFRLPSPSRSPSLPPLGTALGWGRNSLPAWRAIPLAVFPHPLLPLSFPHVSPSAAAGSSLSFPVPALTGGAGGAAALAPSWHCLPHPVRGRARPGEPPGSPGSAIPRIPGGVSCLRQRSRHRRVPGSGKVQGSGSSLRGSSLTPSTCSSPGQAAVPHCWCPRTLKGDVEPETHQKAKCNEGR